MRLRWLPFSHISLPLVASLVTQTSLSAHEIRQSALFREDLLSFSLGFEVQPFVVWTSSDQKQLHVIHPISVYLNFLAYNSFFPKHFHSMFSFFCLFCLWIWLIIGHAMLVLVGVQQENKKGNLFGSTVWLCEYNLI